MDHSLLYTLVCVDYEIYALYAIFSFFNDSNICQSPACTYNFVNDLISIALSSVRKINAYFYSFNKMTMQRLLQRRRYVFDNNLYDKLKMNSHNYIFIMC